MSNKEKEKEKEASKEGSTEKEKDASKEGVKGKKKKNDKNEKKIPIPNTLTIYIKTRIPNYTKLIYEPYMTVPTSKSHTVYFDPLIQYIKGAIKDIPPKAPPDAKYTQFFEANQFDSLINRCISKIFNFQKDPAKLLNLQNERTLDQAIEEDLINKNIQLTLSSLFKQNGLFYINKRPYTILDKKWKTDGWDVDTKTENKLTSPYSNLSYNDAQKEADEELAAFKNKYSTEGSPGATENENFEENLEILKNNPNIEDEADHSVLFNAIQGSEAFEDEQNLITQNYPIQFTNAIDKATEPITFSLLLDREVFVKYLEEKTETGKSLLNKYSRYRRNKEELYKIKKEYHDIFIQIGKKKGEYDDKSSEIFVILIPTSDQTSDQTSAQTSDQTSAQTSDQTSAQTSDQTTDIFKSCEDLHDLYIEFMELLITSSELLASLYDKQILYFNSIVDFLKEFKKEYTTIIKYYKDTAELANMCIDADVHIYELLSIQTDVTSLDINSQLYFKNIANLKVKKEKLVKERSVLSDINIQETVTKYTADPWILILLQNQFDIYTRVLSSSFYSNQTNIWKIYYKDVENLVNNMIKSFIIKMQETIDKEDQYSKDYAPSWKTQVGVSSDPSIPITGKSIEETTEYLEKKYAFTGVKKNTDIVKTLVNFMQRKKSVPENKWRLINDEDMYVVKNDDTNKVDIEYERRYIDILQYEVELFDSIILITNLLQIKCLRQYGLYTAEENANQIELLMLKSYLWYYLAIKGYTNIPTTMFTYSEEISINVDYFTTTFKKFKYPSPTFQIPNSILWNTSILNKTRNQNPELFLIPIIEEIYISILMQNYKIREISQTKSIYIEECNNFAKTVEAKMGSTNIKNTCNELLETFTNFTFTTQFVSFSMFNTDDVELKNIDLKKTIRFNNAIKNQLFMSGNDQRWIIYKNEEYYRTNINDNYYKKKYSENILTQDKYSAYFGERFLNIFLGAIKDILNKQLDHLNAITINLYTDVLENKNRFTINSLKRIINDDNPVTIQLLMEGKKELNKINYVQDPGLPDQTSKIGIKLDFLNHYQTLIIDLLRKVLKINIYIFDIPDTDQFKLGTHVALKTQPDELYIITKINKNKEGISYSLKNDTNNFSEAKADEITFSGKSEFDNETFKMSCDQTQNPLVTENILFLLRTTDDIFDYNYEIIGTFLEEYIFSESDSSIYNYFENMRSLCLNPEQGQSLQAQKPSVLDQSLKDQYRRIVMGDLGLKFNPKSDYAEAKLAQSKEQNALYADILNQYNETNKNFASLNEDYEVARYVYISSKIDTNEGSVDIFKNIPDILDQANNCLEEYHSFDELISSLLIFNIHIDDERHILVDSLNKEFALHKIILDLNIIIKNSPNNVASKSVNNNNARDDGRDDGSDVSELSDDGSELSVDGSVTTNKSDATFASVDSQEPGNNSLKLIWEKIKQFVKDLKKYQLACIGSISDLNKGYQEKEKNEFKAIGNIYKALIDLYNVLNSNPKLNSEIINTKIKEVSGIIEQYKDFQNKKDPNKYQQIKRWYTETIIPMITTYIGQEGGDPKRNINRSRPRPREEYYNYAKFNQPLMPGQPFIPGQPLMPGQPFIPGQQFIPGQPFMPGQQFIPGQMYGPQSFIPGQPMYNQGQTYSQPMYNQGQIHSPYGQQTLDYYNHNFQYNLTKEGKSKLSYYITVELDLYPGTDIGTVKKYAMKCQSTFEKIRKSLSDLFGYQYRPLEIKEAYAYEAEYDANMKIKEEQEREKARDLERDKRDQERDRDRDRNRERDQERNKAERERNRERDLERNKNINSRNRDKKGGKSLKKYKKSKSKNRSLKKRK
jgi:hypothetical protein